MLSAAGVDCSGDRGGTQTTEIRPYLRPGPRSGDVVGAGGRIIATSAERLLFCPASLDECVQTVGSRGS